MEETQKTQNTEITETDTSSVEEEEELADRQQSPAKRARQHNCTICSTKFDSLRDCLKHELLEHNNKKKRSQKTLRSKVNAILKTLRDKEKQIIRTELREALEHCSAGQEMATICKIRGTNAENIQIVYQRIHKCLDEELRSLRSISIYPFGSVVSGLALKDSDIDLHMRHSGPPYLSEQQLYNRVCRLLHRSRCFTKVIPVRMARVPIIKCEHVPTGYSLDINMSSSNSVHNTNFVRDILLLDPRFHELMLFLKIWAKQLQIIGRGSMTSYCLIMLTLFYLQNESLLPSVRDMQTHITPVLVDDINYAYSLREASATMMTSRVTLRELIEDFFSYWADFDFGEFIVAPYLGQKISLSAFKYGGYVYAAYNQQMHAMNEQQLPTAAPLEPLKIDGRMCVQDPFILNCNVARSISQTGLEHFRQCVRHAKEICQTHANATDARLYKELLCNAVEQLLGTTTTAAIGVPTTTTAAIDNTELNKVIVQQSNNQPNELKHNLTPCRAEMRAIVAQNQNGSKPPETKQIYQLWLQHYREAIHAIINEIYCLDIQPAAPAHNDKQQRLDAKSQRDTETWLISGSLDLWTGRLHQRSSNQTFMEYQRAQTEAFIRERRQNADYAVQLNGLLNLNVRCEGTALELVLTPKDDNEAGLTKKNPLRKFFMMLKFSLQSFNLKEKLQMATHTTADDTGNHSLT